MPLEGTPFSLGIVLPDGYGQKRIRGEEELTRAAKRGMQSQSESRARVSLPIIVVAKRGMQSQSEYLDDSGGQTRHAELK